MNEESPKTPSIESPHDISIHERTPEQDLEVMGDQVRMYAEMVTDREKLIASLSEDGEANAARIEELRAEIEELQTIIAEFTEYIEA